MAKPFVVVTIRPRNLVKHFSGIQKSVRPELRKSNQRLARYAINTMKNLVPVRTGRLRQSIRMLSKNASDLRGNTLIGSNLEYAQYQDKGTKPSSGRYVPVLGRRITTGRHPGFKGKNFRIETQKRVEARTVTEISKVTRSIKRHFRRGT